MDFSQKNKRNLAIALALEYILTKFFKDNTKNGFGLDFLRSGYSEKILGDEIEKFRLSLSPSVCEIEIPEDYKKMSEIIISAYDTGVFDDFYQLLGYGIQTYFPGLSNIMPVANIQNSQ